MFRPAIRLAALGSVLALAACGNAKQPQLPNMQTYRIPPAMQNANSGLGNLFTLGGKSGPSGQATGVSVNAYLWRASLDTLSFMPLASADPFAGVIITDWYSPPATPNERFKATAYVLGSVLSANDLKVSVFRQTMSGGEWVDAPVDPATASGIEDRILARAAQLKAAGQLNG
ncbi:DUF3576 domain-containing protein [Acidiphilium sp. AL]|uniref:DUF3576 domain-containing protein n=2 Tax=Acidocellaceae TaxID=3385905 RepID=A0ABS9E3B4_9PROT|nr:MULTISPECIES: DUF3576 domain-containing protein [Acidiphilium]MCF3948147.1 DUF3576 domain-containing protein [Acidiphilium iwatense]MCU4161544.1 DUF3576 domain-containing protein [Acidiphilium sp. AL]